MNYKQCIEYMELNSAKTDAPKEAFEKCRMRAREIYIGNDVPDKLVLSFVSCASNLLAMNYLAKAYKSAGKKVILFSVDTIGEYRARWTVGGKPLSQKCLCDAAEWIRAFEEQERVSFSQKQREVLIAEYVLGVLEADVMLTDYAYDGSQENWGWELHTNIQAPNPVYKIKKQNSKRQVVEFDTYKEVSLGTLGKTAIAGAYQALVVNEDLKELDFSNAVYSIEDKYLYRAMEEAYVTPGFGYISSKPIYVVDGAEDGDSAERLIEDIKQYLPNKQVVFIWGATKETKIEEMIPILIRKASFVITVAPSVRERIPSFDLASQIMQSYPAVTAVDSLEEAGEIVEMVLPKDGAVVTVGCAKLLSDWAELNAK